MGWYDKFNDWYVRSIPETDSGTVVSWQEPAAGARYRWKSGQKQFVLLMPLFLLGLTISIRIGRHGRSGPPLATSFALAVAGVVLIYLVNWLSSASETYVAVGPSRIQIGSGRGQRRIALDKILRVSMTTADGYRVLILEGDSKELDRLYLVPEKEAAAVAVFQNAGIALTQLPT